MKLLLIRHPAPDIDRGICFGRLDVPLRSDTTAAVKEITDAVCRHGIGVVWSSPAKRCLMPAQAASMAAGARLRIDDRLQELNFGRWEGMPWADVSRTDLDRWAADPLGFAPPDGETGSALLARAREFHQSLIAASVDCAVISHGGPLRVLHALACGDTPDLLAQPPPFGAVISVNECAEYPRSSQSPRIP